MNFVGVMAVLASLCGYSLGHSLDLHKYEYWGDVSNITSSHTIKMIEKAIPNERLRMSFNFPEISRNKNGPVTIVGIEHVDRTKEHSSKIKFVTGGIGDYFVRVNILSKPGQPIDSLFIFYTSPRKQNASERYPWEIEREQRIIDWFRYT